MKKLLKKYSAVFILEIAVSSANAMKERVDPGKFYREDFRTVNGNVCREILRQRGNGSDAERSRTEAD